MNESKEVKEILAERGAVETSSPARRRELIKTLIIVFLVIMLILTFFSNTIMNRSLAEVSTEAANAGKLVERISRTGVVESNQSYDVTVDSSKTIKKIHIKVGQEIKAGDVLFTVDTVSSKELESEEETLESAKLEYQKALLTLPTDYTAENQKIRILREELSSLIAKRDAARANEGIASAARSEYNRNKAEFERLTDERTNYESTVRMLDSDSLADADIELIGNLASLYFAYISAEEEYTAAYGIYEKAVESGENAEIAKADADAKQAVRDSARSAYDEAKMSVRSDLVARLAEIKSTSAELSAKIEEYTANYGSSSEESYETLAASVIAKQNELESELNSLAQTQKKDSIDDQKAALDLDAQKKALDKMQEKFDKKKKEAKSTEVTAKYGGVVSSINARLDESPIDGVPAATIDLVEDGFTIVLTGVELEKAKKLKKGISADVLNNYRGDVEVTLKEIKNDTASGSKYRQLVFDVKGDVVAGDSLNLSIPCGSGTYDAIIPKSAYRSDNNGGYVYIVNSKNSPLGNRYYVERVEVNLAAEDETSCAIEGAIGRGDYVITASSKPIEPGVQVRMKDK
ncbi:MAG: RND transporter [Ruminococcus sp.]|uniref:biotin/lipoyl-binding protein n=1 Tax=Ruminococcus sp. TaxID=41978 RepID=UPI001AFF529C|nr:biotin/lipoyl-binding protein [Ruminococcus sp.]MBO7474191.1 RND transporter [Ruminococcus sp.]